MRSSMPTTKSRLSGVITDRNGMRLAKIFVALLLPNGGVYSYDNRTDDNGRYEFRGYPAGTYYLRAADELYGGVDCSPDCPLANATPIVVKEKERTVGRKIRAKTTPASPPSWTPPRAASDGATVAWHF